MRTSKYTPETIARAKQMRREGALYPEIHAATNIALHSISNYLKGLKLTKAEKALIQERKRASWVKTANNTLKKYWENKRKPKAPKVKRSREELIKEYSERLEKAHEEYLLSYRPYEEEIKPLLEAKYRASFTKEYIEGAVIQFASKKYLISVSLNKRADYHMPTKYAIISSLQDKRKRIAYLYNTAGKAAERLGKLKVEVRSVNELEGAA